MNILFLGYWGANEGLSKSTIYPHLEILSQFDHIEQIVYCSIERNGDNTFNITIPKVNHIPLYSKASKIPLKDKVSDFTDFPKMICSLIAVYNIEKLICRGAPAGALGYLIWKKTNIPYYVESYEPHAQYMLESKTWLKFDPRYIAQKRWEKKQNITAEALMPVSEHYKNQLILEGVDQSKIDVIPCCVNTSSFKHNKEKRQEIRATLGLSSTDKVFIYVGKFGGLYVEKEACLIFNEILKSEHHTIIILSPTNPNHIKTILKNEGLDESRFLITKCDHSEVPHYLSASDYGLALYKQGESKKHLSPIKIGEYWACGLPVLLPSGIGYDSDIIDKEGGGATFESYSPNAIKSALERLLKDTTSTVDLAEKHRSFNITRTVYSKWYSN